jgi:leucyl aminopeptidase
MNASSCFEIGPVQDAVPIYLVQIDSYVTWLGQQTDATKNWLKHNAFKPDDGQWLLLPDSSGGISACVLVYDRLDVWTIGALPAQLPEAVYRLEPEPDEQALHRLALGWGLGCYRYSRYLTDDSAAPLPRLLIESRAMSDQVDALVDSIYLVRDLVNAPAQDMMPQHLSEATQALADRFDAQFSEVVGDQLLERNYPAIHAVGRASVHPPRLLELQWGDEHAPRLTLVGKGVCFDSGGLDLKPAAGMRLMKKDMGGAAHALGLAQMIMSAGLQVRLHVLIPAVENAVSGDAFRPGDILHSRKGLSIEVDNTDAEGRLVLCDAMTRAAEESPELLLDFATLTGAARVALGTEVPVFFTDNEALAKSIQEYSADWNDLVWRLPLHEPYRQMIESKMADIVNSSREPFGGAITAALFLKSFVEDGQNWAHFDLMAWNQRARPGRPEGGEAMGLLGLFAMLRDRYA